MGISTKRLLGWEPEERHEHYDADGRLTGYTLVSREQEWDDRERDRMLALGIFESGLGPCGYHHSLTSDRNNYFDIETEDCLVCRSVAIYTRIQADNDEKAMKHLGEEPRPDTPRPDDGRRTFVRQLSPLEVAMRASSLSAARSVLQGHGQLDQPDQGEDRGQRQ